MRTHLAVIGLLPAVIALASCGPRTGRFDSSAPAAASRSPVILSGEPTCAFQVLTRISGRDGGAYNRTPAAQARAVGADAVLDLRYSPEFVNNRQVGRTWEGIAIKYSDPTDPNCSRAGSSGSL
jgi:hypothetical protein